jgi:hypothetical protein
MLGGTPRSIFESDDDFVPEIAREYAALKVLRGLSFRAYSRGIS